MSVPLSRVPLTPEDLRTLTPQQVAERLGGLPGTLGERLGVRYLEASSTRVLATMPVEGNLQPAGRLHGGASMALAEEVASVGSWLGLDITRQSAVGVDFSATHVRGVTGGLVTAEGLREYAGRRMQVWVVTLRGEDGRTTSLCRCTCHVIDIAG